MIKNKCMFDNCENEAAFPGGMCPTCSNLASQNLLYYWICDTCNKMFMSQTPDPPDEPNEIYTIIDKCLYCAGNLKEEEIE